MMGFNVGFGIIIALFYLVFLGFGIFMSVLFIKVALRGIKALDIYIKKESMNHTDNHIE